jgi:hypothetical protein
MVIWISPRVRLSSGSTTELANRPKARSPPPEGQPVIDPEDGLSPKYWCIVSLSFRSWPGPRRTAFHHHPRAPGAASRGDAPGDPPEQERLHLHVEQHRSPARSCGHGLVGGVVVEVTVHVAEQAGIFTAAGVPASMLLSFSDAVA